MWYKNDMDGMNDKILRISELVAGSDKVVVFTGAGASTESGIPDFRSPGGIWSRFDPDEFTIQKFISSSETRRKQWKFLIESGLITDARPNRAHLAIAELEKMGKLRCVITQNIDNLHQKAGNQPQRVFELHGTMGWARCMDCRARFPLESIMQMLAEVDYLPECGQCSGMLKPDVVFFGESLPERTLQAAIAHARSCDLFIVIGSSLVVYPAAYLPLYAVEVGAKLVIINNSPTPYDDRAEVVIDGSAGEAMERIIDLVKKM
jgi:NAD-dependent deacetylase